MKILIGMPSKDSWGGPISSEPPFVEALRNLGHETVEEVYVYGDKDRPTPIYERFRRVVVTASRFKRTILNQSFDIIHLNTAFDLRTLLRDTFSLWRMRPGKAKVFLKLHGSEAQRFFEAGPLERRLVRFLNSRVDGFGVHTSEERDNFLKLGFEKEKFYFCKNVVTLSQRIPAGYSRRHRDHDATFQLLYVGRFVEKKGLLETIHAAAILRDTGVKFVLYCLGDGELKQSAEDLVSELGLERNVQFTGYIAESEVERYFFDTDIFVFPTQFGEGFPNVFFKAMAAGMPIVSTKFRAARDYLVENENYVPCQSEPNSIAENVRNLIDDKPLRLKMSERNKEYGSTLLPENIAREYLAIYQDLLK